jgi:hypothetical protein
MNIEEQTDVGNKFTPLEEAILNSNRQANERLARVDERLERAANLLIQSIEHDNERAVQRDRWMADLSAIVGSAVAGRATGESATSRLESPPSKTPVGYQPVQPVATPMPQPDIDVEAYKVEKYTEEKNEGEDTFQMIVAVMIAIVSLVAAVGAWRGTMVKVEDADIATLYATMNAETTEFMSNSELHNNYRAYSTYTLNETLQQQLEKDLGKASGSTKLVLTDQQAMASDLIGTNQLFFLTRYLDRDGSYNTGRALGEAWAKAEQLIDVHPEIHASDADNRRYKNFLLAVSFVPVAISLLFYTLAESLHSSHTILRYGSAFAGTVFLIISAMTIVMVETSM